MKETTHIILLCAAVALIVGCTDRQQSTQSERSNSLWEQEKEASSARDLNRTLAIIDTLEMEKHIGTPRADYARAMAYDWAWQMRLAEHFYQKSYDACREDPSGDWGLYAETGYRTAYFRYTRYDSEGALNIITEMLSLAKVNEAFPTYMKSALLLLMSSCQIQLHQNDAARQSMMQAYEMQNQTEDLSNLQHSLITCADIFEFLHEMGEYEAAQQWLVRGRETLAVYEQHGDSAWTEEWKGKLALYEANLLLGTGHPAESRAVYDAIPRSRIYTPASIKYATTYLMAAGRYEEAIDCYDRLDEVTKDNGSAMPSFDKIAERLTPRYITYRKVGRSAEALVLADSICADIDSALVHQKKSDAAELAIIYQTHEKELALEESETRSTIYCILAIGLAVILVLIASLLLRAHKYNKVLADKNRRLLAEIEQRERGQQQAIKQLNAEPEDALTVSQQFYRRLCTIMAEQKPYTNESLNRDTLAQLLGTNAKYVEQAIRECSYGETVGDFINRYRLEHVARLLKTTDDSISLIGEQSGIPSRATLSRIFRNAYGMTCSEYRQAVKSKATEGPTSSE